nr:unnamed protein product [Callosobruchus chinensis]
MSYISMQISDGIEASPVYQLRVSVSPQYWRLERNTGLTVLHQTSAIITPHNLSFTSNVAIPDYTAVFTIVKKPRYGVVEVEKTVTSWEAVDTFTGSDLKQHRVRYRHTTSKPDFDEFQFRTLDKTQTYTFRLTFVKCTLFKQNVRNMQLSGQWEVTITNEDLSFETKPPKVLTYIHYVISKPPQYGFLFSSVSKYRLKTCDMFTQEDIALQNIKYRFYQKPYSDIEDIVTFAVLSPGCNNLTTNFTIGYVPKKDERSQVTVSLTNLEVDEGASAIIDSSHLALKANFVSEIIYNVTEKPRHGFLQLVNKEIVKNDTDHFTSEDLKTNSLHYIHDGSETQTDVFTFLALSTNDENFEYVGQFNIKVTLKNDNSPVRVVDKVFHIVVGGERLITGKDLKYTDDDLDTPTSAIVYTCRESSNGNFFNINNINTKVSEFTQEDLDNNRIIFKHKGPEYGKVRLWVTDGQFHVNGVLEIQASAPFIHVEVNRRFIVQHGSSAVITSDHLSYSTNLFALDRDVFYEIVTKPSFGKVVSTQTQKTMKNFTQEDVHNGLISYVNENTGGSVDEIVIRVRCRDAVNIAHLSVLMLPANYWEPLEPKHLKKLSVEEATSVHITKKLLEVYQPNVPPSAIVYYIADMPEYGYISIISDTKNGNEPVNVMSFSQDLINENKIIYIQSVANQTKDKVVFNVTNGIVWRNNLQLPIEIIPERLYLGTNNLIVNEGGIVALTPNHLFVLTDYYKSKVTMYTIKDSVKHGCVQLHKRCIKSKAFSLKELQAGVVQYAHDGSENMEDQMIIIGETGTKKSVPVVLKITVLPVNDQKPKLVNNTGLVMWEGGTATITNEMLAATDDDRPEETLKYHVQSCWWGSVSLVSDLTTPLNYFTQELIDKRMVIFHHQNGTEARFKFNISDGLHTTKDYMFFIKTKPVQLKLTSKPLHIFPLQRKYLTSNHLLTVISDPDREVHYDVIVSPTLGRLMMESENAGIFKVVNTFTQSDLNNSKVFYEHTHQFSDLYANDSFTFNVRAHTAPKLTNQVLKIDISVSSGGLDAFVSIPKISVDEGGLTNIPLNLSGVVSFLENHAGLRAPIIHASALPPQHGQIFLQHARNLTTFTQQQLESSQVYYEHDHSDSLGDNIHFSLYLIPGYVTLCNLTVPVIVNPINDQPFNLVTPAPSLLVVQGENHTITRHELATEDSDTPPSMLKYDVISGPSHGKLVLMPENVAVIHFTQGDIDDGRLVYVHDGSALTDSFHFRIWDEKFRPEFHLFNVMVTPINITVLPGVPVYLLQGSDVELLTVKQFYIQTNADKNKIQFNMKRKTKHGMLYKEPFYKDKPITSFTYLDLLHGKVMYLQTDMTTANDSFQVLAEINTGNNSFGNDVEVFIKVKPFMHIHNLTTKAAEVSKITLQTLDSTPLAKITNSNPRYTIIKQPKYGQIKKIIRSSGEKRNVLDTAVTAFTHEEVQSGLIYLAVKDIEVPWEGFQDKLVFMVAATIFQPAVGELKINIKSPLNNDIQSTLPGPSDPASHEGGLHLSSPNMTKDYLLIVSMAVGVVVLGIGVVVVIKCRSIEGRVNKEECIQPIPLPRPPDRLMSSSPTLKTAEDSFTPIPGGLPQCKVTPLNRGELDSPSPHPCYPYGVDDNPDDWSSIDASSDPPCPTKNIMLRRNQYWV